MRKHKESDFIGRVHEEERLKQQLNKDIANLVVIRGRRRIGKSRLIEEFAKPYEYYNFTGLNPEEGITAQVQRDEFARKLKVYFGFQGLEATDWADLFAMLGKGLKSIRKKMVVMLDEISWMGMEDATFLPKLKVAWDTIFKKNSNLMLVLCGSISSWIEKNIISSTGFLGRISLKITLDNLSLTECNQLLTAKKFCGSTMEKYLLLSVTGGVPWYIELMNGAMSAENNIKELCFSPDGILVEEFKRIFHDLFGKRADIYQRIVETLIKGPADYQTISKESKYESGGILSEYLADLVMSGYIRLDQSWSIKTGAESSLGQYRIKDNYLRFYLKYIELNKNKINKKQFKNIAISSLPGWGSMMGLQFENMVVNNRELIWKALGISPEEIDNDNPFFQRKTKVQRGCQVDYMIQTKLKTIFVCEIKFSKNPIGLAIIEEMKEKISRIKLPKGYSVFPVLIHVSGMTDELEDSGYFIKTIDCSEWVK